jgi:hypothetical protein
MTPLCWSNEIDVGCAGPTKLPWGYVQRFLQGKLVEVREVGYNARKGSAIESEFFFQYSKPRG